MHPLGQSIASSSAIRDKSDCEAVGAFQEYGLASIFVPWIKQKLSLLACLLLASSVLESSSLMGWRNVTTTIDIKLPVRHAVLSLEALKSFLLVA